jgi:hypothetical protein
MAVTLHSLRDQARRELTGVRLKHDEPFRSALADIDDPVFLQ